MTALEKFREVVAATRASGGKFVVRTLDEAQAVLDEIDDKRGARSTRSTLHTAKFGAIDAPGDDEVV